MKSLSKAQQEVVNKMREGWELHPPFMMKKEYQKHWIRYSTFCALRQKGVVETMSGTNNIYQLTEKYRTNER